MLSNPGALSSLWSQHQLGEKDRQRSIALLRDRAQSASREAERELDQKRIAKLEAEAAALRETTASLQAQVSSERNATNAERERLNMERAATAEASTQAAVAHAAKVEAVEEGWRQRHTAAMAEARAMHEASKGELEEALRQARLKVTEESEARLGVSAASNAMANRLRDVEARLAAEVQANSDARQALAEATQQQQALQRHLQEMQLVVSEAAQAQPKGRRAGAQRAKQAAQPTKRRRGGGE